jgi:toxin ParE1/3/4
MPGVRVEFASEAAAEVEAAKVWYSERSAFAALAFADDLSAAVERIREAPDRWPKGISGTHRHLLSRFPFMISYRKKGRSIQIVAVAHAKRKPEYWKHRLKS